jgi:hypothetical protein
VSFCPQRTLGTATRPQTESGFGGLGVWYPSSRVRTRPKPSDFSVRKNPQHAFLRRFAACKRSLQMAWNSPFFGKITGHFSPTVPLSRLEVSCVFVGVGAPCSYNKPTWLQYFRGHQPQEPNRRTRRRNRKPRAEGKRNQGTNLGRPRPVLFFFQSFQTG